MSPMRALIVDDEPLAVRRLNHSLAAFEDVEVAGTTTSARQAVEMIAELRPDVVFLDIAMPGLGGFEVVSQVPADARPAIVFITAYDRYAVRAFSIDAADYLMKPVAPERLGAALGRARNWLRARATTATSPANDATDRPLRDSDNLWVHRRGEFARVPVGEIDWIEADGDYVRLHAKQSGGMIRATIGSLAARFDPADFIRVHRSIVCRTRSVAGLRRKSTGALVLLLDSGDELPVGRSYVRGLRALLARVRD